MNTQDRDSAESLLRSDSIQKQILFPKIMVTADQLVLAQTGPMLEHVLSFLTTRELLIVEGVSSAWQEAVGCVLRERRVCVVHGSNYIPSLSKNRSLTGWVYESKAFFEGYGVLEFDGVIRHLSRHSQCVLYFTTTARPNFSLERIRGLNENGQAEKRFRHLVKLIGQGNLNCPVINMRFWIVVGCGLQSPTINIAWLDGFSALAMPKTAGVHFIPFYVDRRNGENKWTLNTDRVPDKIKGALVFADTAQLRLSEEGDVKKQLAEVPTMAGICSSIPSMSHFPGSEEAFTPLCGFYIAGRNVSVDNIAIFYDWTYAVYARRLRNFMEKLNNDTKGRKCYRIGLYFGAYNSNKVFRYILGTMTQELRTIENALKNVKMFGALGERVFYGEKELQLYNDEMPDVSSGWREYAIVLSVITVCI